MTLITEQASAILQHSLVGTLAKYGFNAPGLGVLTALFIILRVAYLLYFHPLGKIPGPTLAKLTSLWQAYYVARLTRASKVEGIF